MSDVARAGGRHHRGRSDPVNGVDRCEVAVASAAIAAALTGSPRSWRVVGSSTAGWWCTDDHDVLVFTADRSVRLPNSVLVDTVGPRAVDSVRPDDRVVVGNGVVAWRSRRWRIVRWWDPRVAPMASDMADTADTIRGATLLVRLDRLEPLMAPLRARDHLLFAEEAGRWIGRGEGLTPEGDDVLAGVVAGYRRVGASIDDHTVASLLECVRPAVLTRAGRATTLLSSSLLRHAFAGEVAGPVAALLRAITGRGELTAALAATNGIGHSSGPALAAGVVAGAASACGVRP